MSVNLMQASNQWATRPADERFWNLEDLAHTLEGEHASTHQRNRKAELIRALGGDGEDLMMTYGGDTVADMSHWAFNQIATYAKAPADYLRRLPAKLAAECLNNGLTERGKDELATLLIHENGNRQTIRSLTSDQYSRLWDLSIVKSLRNNAENGWMTPPARPAVDDPRARVATIADILPNQGHFGLSVRVGDMIAPAGVYRGDRDMFIFEVMPERVIDDGVKGLMRGAFISNSEVGAKSFKVTAFYLENVCGNHIVWGAKNVRDFKVIHKGNAINGVMTRMNRQLQNFANTDTKTEVGMIRVARSYVLGKDKEEVVKTVSNLKNLQLSQKDAESSFQYAEEWEETAKAPPVSAWGFVHGLTRYSQTKKNADDRSKLDAIGGKILEMAASSHNIDTSRLALPSPK
jgi:hypothetical protein